MLYYLGLNISFYIIILEGLFNLENPIKVTIM